MEQSRVEYNKIFFTYLENKKYKEELRVFI